MPDELRTPPAVASWLAHAGLAAAVATVLAWHDVLPGGWSLRGFVEPHSARRARAIAVHASERLAAFRAEDRAANEGKVVFLGASNIERLQLAELFPGKPTLNRGIAGATAEELTGLLPRLALPEHAAGFVVHAGANDWRGLGLPSDEIAPRVERLVDAIAEHAHAAPILILGLLPERGASREFVRDRAEIDGQLTQVAARVRSRGHRVSFLAVARPPLSSADGSLAEEFSSDPEHLDAAGARELARWIVNEGGAVGRFLAP